MLVQNAFVAWVHATETATVIRESQVIYPLLQCVHILGIGLFAGGVIMTNLRVVGAGQAIALGDFAQHAMRVAWIGLAMILGTGLFMAASFIDVFWVSTVMQLKVIAVLFAVANAVVLQRFLVAPSGSPIPVEPDARARALAATGIAVLLAIITLGKLLAYIGGKD